MHLLTDLLLIFLSFCCLMYRSRRDCVWICSIHPFLTIYPPRGWLKLFLDAGAGEGLLKLVSVLCLCDFAPSISLFLSFVFFFYFLRAEMLRNEAMRAALQCWLFWSVSFSSSPFCYFFFCYSPYAPSSNPFCFRLGHCIRFCFYFGAFRFGRSHGLSRLFDYLFSIQLTPEKVAAIRSRFCWGVTLLYCVVLSAFCFSEGGFALWLPEFADVSAVPYVALCIQVRLIDSFALLIFFRLSSRMLAHFALFGPFFHSCFVPTGCGCLLVTEHCHFGVLVCVGAYCSPLSLR